MQVPILREFSSNFLSIKAFLQSDPMRSHAKNLDNIKISPFMLKLTSDIEIDLSLKRKKAKISSDSKLFP